jgi:hypothetical protein
VAKQKQPTFGGLLRASLIFWRNNFGFLSGVILPLSVPLALLGLLEAQETTTYLSAVSLLLGLAVSWSIVALEKRSKRLSVKQVYYEGTAGLIKYVLVVVALVLQAAPLLLALSVLAIGLDASVTVTVVEKLLMLGLASLLALPSLYWLPRYIFAVFEILEPKQTPLLALRASRAAVKDRYWYVLRRLVAMMLVTILLLTIPTLVFGAIYQATEQPLFLAMLEVLSSLVFLPLNLIYLRRLQAGLHEQG